MWDFLPIHTVEHLRGQALIWREGLAHNLHFSSFQCVWWGWGQSSVQASQVLPHQTHRTMSLWSCWNRKGPYPNWQCSSGICQTQTPSDLQPEKCVLLLHRTGFHCSRVQWWCTLHHSIQRSTELFRTTHFFTPLMFENADCMARCLILYTCDNWSDCNTWIQ